MVVSQQTYSRNEENKRLQDLKIYIALRVKPEMAEHLKVGLPVVSLRLLIRCGYQVELKQMNARLFV